MQTIASARAWAVNELNSAGTESAVLASDLLLGFVTGHDRTYVISHPEECLPEASLNRFRSLILHHARGVPLQYLTGERGFYGLDFHVSPAVLIPRPETETLVEAAIRIIQENYVSGVCFTDIGTGSGCIAVSIAYAVPSSIGWGTDISGQALEVARFNAERHGVSDRIEFVRANGLECFLRKPFFDLILCNPPYVPIEEYDTLPSGVRDYEPIQALFGGRDGLDFYRRMVPETLPRLKPGGFLMLELGAGQADRIKRLVEKEGLAVEAILCDLRGIPRCLVARAAGRTC